MSREISMIKNCVYGCAKLSENASGMAKHQVEIMRSGLASMCGRMACGEQENEGAGCGNG